MNMKAYKKKSAKSCRYLIPKKRYWHHRPAFVDLTSQVLMMNDDKDDEEMNMMKMMMMNI